MTTDINCLYNEDGITVTSETQYNEDNGRSVIVFQLQHNGDIKYRGTDKNRIKQLKTEIHYEKQLRRTRM